MENHSPLPSAETDGASGFFRRQAEALRGESFEREFAAFGGGSFVGREWLRYESAVNGFQSEAKTSSLLGNPLWYPAVPARFPRPLVLRRLNAIFAPRACFGEPAPALGAFERTAYGPYEPSDLAPDAVPRLAREGAELLRTWARQASWEKDGSVILGEENFVAEPGSEFHPADLGVERHAADAAELAGKKLPYGPGRAFGALRWEFFPGKDGNGRAFALRPDASRSPVLCALRLFAERGHAALRWGFRVPRGAPDLVPAGGEPKPCAADGSVTYRGKIPNTVGGLDGLLLRIRDAAKAASA